MLSINILKDSCPYNFSAQISDLAVVLNPDIFETNIVNITILLGGIIYLGRNVLFAGLSKRQQKILGAVQSCERACTKASVNASTIIDISALIAAYFDTTTEYAKMLDFLISDHIICKGRDIFNASNVEAERLRYFKNYRFAMIAFELFEEIYDYMAFLSIKGFIFRLIIDCGYSYVSFDLEQQIMNHYVSQSQPRSACLTTNKV